MAESTLTLAKADLEASVGFFLGFGRGTAKGDAAWDSYQQAAITEVVNSGYRQFLYPPQLDAGGSYDWSFLRPVATLTLASGATTVPLPDDYGGIEGQVIVAGSSSNASWEPIDLTGVGRVYQQAAQYPTTTGRPELCCEEPLKGTSPTQGQRFQLHFWPTADQAYTLQVQYYVCADALSTTFPYCLGGMPHAETILASCLAVAEERLDDAQGPKYAKFMERLAASVSLDRRLKPEVFGYDGDRSDRREWRRQFADHWNSPVQVNGVTY